MSMKSILRNGLVIVLALAFVFAGTTMVMAEEESRVVIGSGAEAPGLDTRAEVDIPAFERINLISEPLIVFNYDLGLEPALAEDWEYSEDGTELTFYLREGVMFHHGREFVADDVKYTIEWILDEDNDAANRDLYAAIEEVEVVNDYEVTLHLSEVNTFLINNIARFGIVPRDKGEELGEDFGNEPVGTGPYVFESWDRDDRMILEAHEDYWGGTPNFDVVEFRAITEDSARLLAFEAGEIDMYQGGVVPDELARLEDDPDVDVYRTPGTGYSYVGFDNEEGPMTDKNLRKAVSHMLNREAIVEHVMQGIGEVGQSQIMPNMPWFHEDLDFIGYDPEKAQQYFQNSVAAEEDVQIRVFTNENPVRMQIAEIMEYELGEIGIDVEVVIEEWGAFLDRIYDTNDYEMFILGWGGQMDPDRASYRQFHSEGSANHINFTNDRMDELLEEGRTVDPNSERSIEIYREVQEILNEEAPKAFINYTEEVALVQPEFEGFEIHSYSANAWLSVPFLERAE